MLIIKSAEELKIAIPENIRNEIGYWLIDMQAKIGKEEEKNLFKEIRDKLNIKKVYSKLTTTTEIGTESRWSTLYLSWRS